jgi:NAD+ kinase
MNDSIVSEARTSDGAKTTPPKHLAVAGNPQMPEAIEFAERISARLTELELDAFWGAVNDEQLRERVEVGPVDLFIALGGDGTMLRAGHLCAPLGIPILGINMGGLGFLTELSKEQAEQAMERVKGGDYWLEERMMLQINHLRSDQLHGTWEVINECFVGRGEIVRPVDLIAHIDGRYLATYVADGLIAATPTGSTAYALAAGGPILPPDLRNILLVPVAPHMSADRALVLHEGSSVRVEVRTDHQAILSIDGGPPIPMQDQDRVEVRAAEHVVHFARLQDPGFFYRNLTSRMNPSRSREGRRAEGAQP